MMLRTAHFPLFLMCLDVPALDMTTNYPLPVGSISSEGIDGLGR
jgi:hypothetical protein